MNSKNPDILLFSSLALSKGGAFFRHSVQQANSRHFHAALGLAVYLRKPTAIDLILISIVFFKAKDYHYVQIGDPKDLGKGYLIACKPFQQCNLTSKFDGDQVFKMEHVGKSALEVDKILSKNAVSFESAKYPGLHMMERSKNGKDIIMLDYTDLSSKSDREYPVIFCMILMAIH